MKNLFYFAKSALQVSQNDHKYLSKKLLLITYNLS